MPNTTLSRAELIARLKEIAADETPKVRHMGAMCYSEAYFPSLICTCENCGNDFSYRDDDSHNNILQIVEEIRQLGYDAMVATICRQCATALKEDIYVKGKVFCGKKRNAYNEIYIRNINHLFFFRLDENEEYHRAIANTERHYQALLSLLQNKPMYLDYYDQSYYISEEIDTLRFMTGINFNE